MALMTREEYIASLRAMHKRVFIRGELVENIVDHPLVRPSRNYSPPSHSGGLRSRDRFR
jgi:4-hydroxybutyryl-CoA dehydratase/vinylacetyl-CoA-Delta-isomerase